MGIHTESDALLISGGQCTCMGVSLLGLCVCVSVCMRVSEQVVVCVCAKCTTTMK